MFVVTHMPLVSVDDQCKELPAPSVSATLEGSSTAWKLAIGLLVWMALGVQPGLKANSEYSYLSYSIIHIT